MNRVNGSGAKARSGASTLVLLSTPLNVRILRSLADGPKQQAELQRQCGLPAQTTLRAQLKRLVEIGALEKHRRNRFPGVLEYELTTAGRELSFVAAVLLGWLERGADGPLALEDNAAKTAIKALAEGWSTTMLRALATGPLTLTELDRVIALHSYPSLERRLAALRLAGLVEARESNGRGTPYAVTERLRRGIAPLAAAARWERRHSAQLAAPIAPIDVEAAFLLTAPLLRLQEQLSGSCRMAAEVPNGRKPRLAGVVHEIRDGNLTGCSTKLSGNADAWALGSIGAWLDAIIDADTDRLELGGDCPLGRALLAALHETLFSVPVRSLLETNP